MQDNKVNKKGWSRGGTNVKYFRNKIVKET